MYLIVFVFRISMVRRKFHLGFQWYATNVIRISVVRHKFHLGFQCTPQFSFFSWRCGFCMVFHIRRGFPFTLGFFVLVRVPRAVAGFPITSCAPTPHAAARRLCWHSAQTHTPEKCVCAVSCFQKSCTDYCKIG